MAVTHAETLKYIKRQPLTQYGLEKTVNYHWTLNNDSNRFLKNIEFTVYAPVKQTAFQYCEELKADREFKLTTDSYQNQLMTFILPRMAPFQKITLRISAKLMMARNSQNISLVPAQFLKPEQFIEADSTEIISIISKLPQQQRTVEKYFSITASKLKNADYQPKDQGALKALKLKSGDCSEHAYLFTALCRAASLPSQYLSGYYSIGNSHLKSKQFHNANFFYENRKWHFADAFLKNFKQSQENFIAFTIHGGKSETLMENNHRFHLKGEGIENLKILMK